VWVLSKTPGLIRLWKRFFPLGVPNRYGVLYTFKVLKILILLSFYIKRVSWGDLYSNYEMLLYNKLDCRPNRRRLAQTYYSVHVPFPPSIPFCVVVRTANPEDPQSDFVQYKFLKNSESFCYYYFQVTLSFLWSRSIIIIIIIILSNHLLKIFIPSN